MSHLPSPAEGQRTRHIADHYGWVLLSTDRVRQQIPPSAGGYYTPAAKAAAYRLMLTQASNALRHGESVLADATWNEVAMRELASGVASTTASRLIALECCVPVEIAAARAQERLTSGHDRSEAGAGCRPLPLRATRQLAGRDQDPHRHESGQRTPGRARGSRLSHLGDAIKMLRTRQSARR